MSDNNQANRPEGPGRKGQEPQFNWRGFLFFGVTLMLVVSALMINTSAQRSTRITYEEFRKYVKNSQVDPNKPLELVQQDASMEQFIRGWRVVDRNTAFVDFICGQGAGFVKPSRPQPFVDAQFIHCGHFGLTFKYAVARI
jgi:hypothetical protein